MDTDRQLVARELIARGAPQEILAFIADCINDGSLSALVAVQLLYEDPYGGFTFNYELKAPAGLALLRWGEQGVDALYEAALRSRTSKNISIAIDVLASAAASGSWLLGSHLLPKETVEWILKEAQGNSDVRNRAKHRLMDLLLAIPSDEDAAEAAASGLGHISVGGLDAAKLVFAALAARWLAIGEPILNQFGSLITQHPGDEQRFQAFLETVPQLLDPMCFQVWSRPDLCGAKEPDFIVRRFDNTYLIVEIETPAKQLVTEGNQISAAATQAISQATQYRQYMMDRPDSMRSHFPEFRDPECLVVIGCEGKLSPSQRDALDADNQSRRRLRVVGFDWLLRRATAIRANTLDRSTSVQRIRVV